MKLRKRVLLNWKQIVFSNKGMYGKKIQAVWKIWDIKSKDAKADVRRAYTIWRDILASKIVKENRLRIILSRH